VKRVIQRILCRAETSFGVLSGFRLGGSEEARLKGDGKGKGTLRDENVLCPLSMVAN
jgi:hypothetical protein